MEIEPRQGGFRKPLSTREFILAHLKTKGREGDYIAAMHRAYKKALKEMAMAGATVPRYTGTGRKPSIPKARRYVFPRYHNFQQQVWQLAQEGLIELARSEPTEGLHGQFRGFKKPPERHYYRLKAG